MGTGIEAVFVPGPQVETELAPRPLYPELAGVNASEELWLCLFGAGLARQFVDGQLQRDERGRYYSFSNLGTVSVGDRHNRIVETMSVSDFVGGVAYAHGAESGTEAPTQALLDSIVFGIGSWVGQSRAEAGVDIVSAAANAGSLRRLRRKTQ